MKNKTAKRKNCLFFSILLFFLCVFFTPNTVLASKMVLDSDIFSAESLIGSLNQTSKNTETLKNNNEERSNNPLLPSLGLPTASTSQTADAMNYRLNDDGTGITVNDFGKTASDIQALNGNQDDIKQLIISSSGAQAYGMQAGSVVDVTSNIQINDLNGLDHVQASSTLQKFTITLTVPASLSGTGEELSNEVVVYIGTITTITNWTQLENAVRYGASTILDIQASFTSTNNDSSWGLDINQTRPGFVLLGNGNSIDFLNVSFYYNTNASRVFNITVDGLDMYGGNFYGPVTMRDYSAVGSSMTYRNVSYHGSQITAAFAVLVRFEGKNTIVSESTQYTSYNGTVRTIPNAYRSQSGLESHTLQFGKNSDTSITVANGDAVILGSWYSNASTVAQIQPSLLVEDGANVILKTLGNSGEYNNWQMTRAAIPAGICMQRNGKVDIQKNAHLTVETAANTVRLPILMGRSNESGVNSYNSSITIGENSILDVKSNGQIPVGTGVNLNASITMDTGTKINIDKNAKLNISTTNMTTGAPVILMGSNSEVSVSNGGELNIDKAGGKGSLLSLASGAKFYVDSLGTAAFSTKDEGTSTDALINGGSSSNFIIGDKGNFISKINNGTGIRNMLNFGTNATFQFSNANQVDLDARGNTNTNLIYMNNPGVFRADIQAVSAWTKADAAVTDPTFNWTPMYGVKVTYNGSTVTNTVANSVTNAMIDNFTTNYKTANFSRVLYDYIPDVVIGFDQPSDNKNLPSGQKLTGVVNNGAALLFYKVVDENDSSKDVLLTMPTENSPIEGDTQKYNTIADNNGTFSYTLPSDVTLYAGEKIRAYAWCNGKDNSEIQTVLDKTPPEGESVVYQSVVNDPVPDPSVFVKNPTDTNPETQTFTYAFNSETPATTIETYMKTAGEYTVKVDLTDNAGNTSTISSILVVNANGQYIGGNDIEIPFETVKTMSSEDLKSYILLNSSPTAFTIVDGEKRLLDNKITVSSLGGLDDSASLQAKNYTVTIFVSASDAGLPTDMIGTIIVKVTDDNPPTATSKVTPIQINDTNAIVGSGVDLKNFLANVADNDTPNDEIVAELDTSQDIATLLSSVGPKDLKIKLSDKSGNSSVITTQILVYDETWVVGATGAVTGIDYNMGLADYDATNGRSITINKGQVKAYDISGERAIDVTDDDTKFAIDLSQVGSNIDIQYPITMTVNDAVKLINVTFTRPASVIVDPEDGVSSFIPSDSDTHNPLTTNTSNDLLKIQYASGFEFGTVKRNLTSDDNLLSDSDFGQVQNGAYKDVPAFVSIADQRNNSTGWNLSVSSTKFVNKSDSSIVLKGAYITLSDTHYAGSATDKPTATSNLELSSDQELISSSDAGAYGSWSLALGSVTSNKKSSGVNLTVPKNSVRNLGDYSTTVVWTLAPKI